MSRPISCRVWWARPGPAWESARDVLSTDERRRLAQHRADTDRSRFLAGRVLLRLVVGAELGVPARSVPLETACWRCGAAHGKPRLAGPAGRLSFSVAHAGERVMVAVACGATVGVDIEPVRLVASGPDLGAVALTDSERATVGALPEPEQPRAVATYWTRKEAVLKATGWGLAVHPASLSVTAPSAAPRVLASRSAEVPADVAMRDLDPGPAHTASLAALTTSPLRVTERWWPTPESELTPARGARGRR